MCPLVSIPSLSEDFSSLFRHFLCNPLPYLENDHPTVRSSFSTFMDIMCVEMMAYSILGIGDVVYETIITNFHAFSEAISRDQIERPWADYDLNLFRKIVEISQNQTDSVERITAFIDLLSTENNPDRHDDRDAHPDRIDSFLERIAISPSLSKTLFRNDRHLNLISTLSQSSSPLFTKLSDPLFDPTFPLHNILSPRSFTDPASSIFRLAGTNPAFFNSLVENHTKSVLDIAVSAAVWIVQVMSDDPSEPRCLDFGRTTQNFVVLLQKIAEMKTDLTRDTKQFNSLPSPLLNLLVLLAASIDDDLSSVAVSVFSNQFGLFTPHTEALLYATPSTFPVSEAFSPQRAHVLGENHTKGPCRSICAEAGRCVVLASRSYIYFSKMLGLHFTCCLVNALHSTTTFPHLFPFFSPELYQSSQMTTVWNDTSIPSALPALMKLADLEINLAYSIPRLTHTSQHVSHPDEEGRDITFLHIFPFLGPESQTKFLSCFCYFYKSIQHSVHGSFERVLECLVEMATVNSYHTPITLLQILRMVARSLFGINPETRSIKLTPANRSPFAMSIVEKLKTAVGEERWKLLTQLAVVSRDDPVFTDELNKVENDAQALFLLSVPTVPSTSRVDYHLDSNLATFDLHLSQNADAFDRVIVFAGRLPNLPLVAAAMFHIANTIRKLVRPSQETIVFNIDRKRVLTEFVLNTLRAMAACRREGVEEGCAVGDDEMTSQIVTSCVKVLGALLKDESFDPTPFVDSLVSLVVTTDLYLLRSILLALQQIEERTRNTPTSFSISTVTAPFRAIHESSVTQQPLPSIVSSILLSAHLDSLQMLHLRFESQPSPGFTNRPLLTGPTISLSHLRGLDETLISTIATRTAETVCLMVRETQASSSEPLTSDHSIAVRFDSQGRSTTPQQLLVALHAIVIPTNPDDLSQSSFLPLAPFFTQILKIVVPSSTDRTNNHMFDKNSQLVNVFLSLVLSLFHTGTPSTLSTPPLSSLLAVLSIAVVRLDAIPSSLNLHSKFRNMFELSENRSNPQLRQIVLALCEEGIEDRSDITTGTLSMAFQNPWAGANTLNPNIAVLFDPLVGMFPFPPAIMNRYAVNVPTRGPFLPPIAGVNVPPIVGRRGAEFVPFVADHAQHPARPGADTQPAPTNSDQSTSGTSGDHGSF
ncbi:hypothetical protein BLNAU_6878 [Blattamonas nauphoetae]|uniref:Uncharacterized protein n=1 Tax=Blattamonas nauphoetae TaxID=2049346 RepID=A0ABQ9Y387_9EUKA|nr:hypothetical protein BLNAU_6878 [Blattamonas nauphoetae]